MHSAPQTNRFHRLSISNTTRGKIFLGDLNAPTGLHFLAVRLLQSKMETVETVRPIFGALIAYNPYRGATNNFKSGIESRRMVYAISDKIHALASVPQKSKLLNRRTERRTDTTSPQCISHKDVNHKKADAAFASFFLIQQQVSYAFQETR